MLPTLRGDLVELVDLSQEIFDGMPVYPGHLKTVLWDHHIHSETGARFEGGFSYASKGLLLSDHGPTHVDALSHLDPREDAPSIEQMPLDTFFGPATCLDVSHKAPRTDITAEDLGVAVDSAGVRVEPGSIVLLHTATFDRHYGTEAYLNEYPGLDGAATEWLVQHQVKAFGVDSPSPDNPASRTYPCHMMCRKHAISHFENLANLRPLVGRTFTFIGLPLKIRGGTGSPVRAIALLHGGPQDGQ